VRRIGDVVASAVLALALSCAPAAAAGLSFGRPSADLASRLMLSLFGETSDATAAFSAQNGDRASESPLREMALQVPPPGANAAFSSLAESPDLMQAHIMLASLSGPGASYLARAVDAGLLSTNAGIAPLSESHGVRAGVLALEPVLYAADYQPVAAQPIVSPGPGTLAFNTTPAPPLPEASNDTLGLGTEIRAPKRSLDLTLSGQYEHMTLNDVAPLTPSGPSSSWQLPDGNAALGAPANAGSNRLSVGAGLAVPVFHGLTLNLNYDAQRLYGSYTLPGLVNLDAMNSKYAGGLTYNIPYSSSSLSISAYQNRLSDSLLSPVNGYTENGGDVNFTVKF
jgi:hypothetical protein